MIDGAPASYVVAAEDVMAVIAERFGITADDLFSLNPTRGAGPALASEQLNLSKKLR
jgi:LysM repeat protein